MRDYSVQLEICGPVALWSRSDTMPNPVSYVAPTFSAAKGDPSLEIGECAPAHLRILLSRVRYCAHTAEDGEGRTLYTLKDGRRTTEKPRLADLTEEQVRWQPLRLHLANVAEGARIFAEPFGLGKQACCAGLLSRPRQIRRSVPASAPGPRLRHQSLDCRRIRGIPGQRPDGCLASTATTKASPLSLNCRTFGKHTSKPAT